MTKKIAAFDQIQHILARLNITDEPSDIGNLVGERWQDNAASPKTGCQYWPYTSVRSSVQPSTDHYIELDTTNPFGSTVDTKPSETTTESHPKHWTQEVNEPPAPLTAEYLDYIESLEILVQRSVSAIAKARQAIEPEMAVLRDLEDKLLFAQHGRQHKAYGGPCNSNHASRANRNYTQTPDRSNSSTFPAMAQYQPPTDNTPRLSIDPTGKKSCAVSKSLGKISRPSDGRFHLTGRCDKHGDEKVFNGIMFGHMSREGQYMASTNAWKCSEELMSGPQREALH